MKYRKLLLLPAATFFCIGCNAPQEIPEGYWQSTQDRPALTLKKDSAGNYRAIFHHRTANGHICPIAYPVVHTTAGMYIQAEGRILIYYSSKDNTIFLSPGGPYLFDKDILNVTNQNNK